MLRESLMDNLINSPFEAAYRLFSPFAEQLFQSLQPQRATSVKTVQLKAKKPPPQSLKKQIISWFSSLPLQERQRATLISDEAIIEMIIRHQHHHPDSHSKISIERICKQNTLEKPYVLRTCKYRSVNVRAAVTTHLRVMCLPGPVLFLTPAYLNSVDGFVRDLERVSGGMVFEYYPRVSHTGNPFWFSNLAFNTIEEWLCACFERSIQHAFQHKSQDRPSLSIQKGHQLIGFYQTQLPLPHKQAILTPELKSFLGDLREVLQLRPTDLTPARLQLIKSQMQLLEDFYNQERSLLVLQQVVDSTEKKMRKRRKKRNNNRGSQKSEQSQGLQNSRGNSGRRESEEEMDKMEERPQEPATDSSEELVVRSEPVLPPPEEDQVIQSEIKPESLEIENPQQTQKIEKLLQTQPETNHKLQPMLQEQLQQPTTLQLQRQQQLLYPSAQSSEGHQQSSSCSPPRKPRRKRKKPPTELVYSTTTLLLTTSLQHFVDQLSTHSNNLLQARMITFQRVRFFIMKLYGEYTVDAKLFGSSAAGLALPTSDIDILLTGFSLETQEEGAGLLQHLAERLRRMRWVGSCETYLHAKVPIIKLEVEPLVDFLEVRGGDWEGLEGLRQVKEVMNLGKKMEEGLRVKVDITVEVKKAEYSHLGCMSTDFMKRWLDIIPNLNPILLILKYLLSARGLNRPYKGGLSSYCLMIMVGAYLKQTSLTSHHRTLSQDLLSVLTFYSEQFDNSSTSLSLLHSQPSFFKTGQQQYLLNVIDPLNCRVLTRNCTEYPTIKQEFRLLKERLLGVCEMVERELEGLPAVEIRAMQVKRKVMEKWVGKYEKEVMRVGIEEVLMQR